jgi:hypothetical protein
MLGALTTKNNNDFMIKQFSLLMICATVILCSCKKDVPGYTNDSDSFSASLITDSINAGELAKFSLTDNPDIITFYSGEIGHVYDYRNRTVLEGGRLNVKFETRVTNRPADTLDVLVSTDFRGIYDSTNVANAHWKKMTNRFVFPDTAAPQGFFYPSGVTSADFADITDSVTAGQPFYMAYKYRNSLPTNIIWSIGKLGMYNVFNNGVANATVIDSNQINSGSFAAVQMGDPGTMRWTSSSTYLKCTNSTIAPLNADYWYISRPLNPSAVAPDLPFVLKNISQSSLTAYNYSYNTPGTYKAVFVASYKRLNFEKTIVKEFTVIVH